VRSAGIVIVASSLPAQDAPPPVDDGIEVTDDLFEGQLVRRASQYEAPSGTAGRGEHPGSAELVEDLRQIVAGHRERLCDVVDTCGTFVDVLGQM
jgi:hypothetical protein